MVDTVRTEAQCLALIPADYVYQGRAPLVITRTGQISAQSLRDCIVSLWDNLEVIQSITTKTGNYTATPEDSFIMCNGTFTVTLYATSGQTGRVLHIKNIGSGTVTVDGNASETIDGSLTIPVTPNESFRMVNDGSNWYII